MLHLRDEDRGNVTVLPFTGARPARDALCRLGPREREVAQVVVEDGEATAEQIRTALSPALSNSAVRTMLTRLVAKGVLRKRKDGKKFVYLPVAPSQADREAALRRISDDYFNGSLVDTARALLAMAGLPEGSRLAQG